MDCPKAQNRHEVIIAPVRSRTSDNVVNMAFREIVLWGESSWWPKKCLMKFVRLENSPIQKGTIYRQKVLLPFAPSWCAVVSDIVENKSISRKFLDGFLDGQETVSIDKLNNLGKGGVKVQYLMDYKVKGFVNKILWRLFFNKMHDRNIRLILERLKEYLEKNANER